MARKIIVVTAAYGHDCIKELGGQSAVLPFIAGSGADVEIRRRLFSADELNQLPALAATIERHNLLACYSAPEALFEADGALNPRLPALLREAQTLNALWLKLSLGHFIPQQRTRIAASHPAAWRWWWKTTRPTAASWRQMQRFKSLLSGESAAGYLNFRYG